MGGAITIFGFNQTMKEMMPGSNGLPIISHIVKSARWAMRKMGRKPPTQFLGTGSMHLGLTTMSAHAVVTAGPDCTIEHRLEILEQSIAAVHARVGAQEINARNEVAKVDARVDEVQRQIGQLDQQMKQRIVGGPKGGGLQIAASGVALAMIGTLLSAIG